MTRPKWRLKDMVDHALITHDELANPKDLTMYCCVNGRIRQDGSTCTMVYGVAHLVR